jgi:hypothetical protein
MRKIVRLTESDLLRLVNRVISEQAKPVTQTGYVRNPRGYTKPTQNNTQFVSCSSLGIKSPGYCDSKTKRPVAPCSQFGVKTPGYCFMDNKQPVPNSGVVKEQLMQTVKNYVNKGVNMLQGLTGNKFWDAALKVKLGDMAEGNGSNQKVFCLGDICEDSITIFSDGRAVFEQAEFDKKTPGTMVFNSDGSFYFKWSDGGKSQIYKPK